MEHIIRNINQINRFNSNIESLVDNWSGGGNQ